MPFTRYELKPGIAVITLDNPPVNAISIGVPREIMSQLDQANADPDVKAVVLAGAGRGFIAGADIREFGKPRDPEEPTLRDLISALEASAKPVFTAMHGSVLGGGLELAMACHYRCATRDATLGQPEVKIGIPPGAGGTQRLPRLVGMKKALDMIVSGDPISAEDALNHGLIDHLVGADLVSEVCGYAASVVAAGDDHPRACDRELQLDDPDIFDAYRKSIERRAHGRRAPYACIECLESAVELPFADGLRREREIFDVCMMSDEAKALRYVFFAERQAGKVPGVDKSTALRDLKEAAVIGAGTMGGGITMNFANAGIPVRILDQTQDALDRGIATITKNYASTVSKGRLSQTDMDARLALITPTLEFSELGNADIVVEAVFEEMPIKLETFKQLDALCKPGAILASNTSYLDVNEIALSTSRADDILGMHFFSPANVMRLLEIVRTDTCSKEVLATVMALAKRMGKVGVVSGVCHGFIGNRMLEGYFREAAFLIEEGATPSQVDAVMTNFGMPMGPFAVSDLAGLDIGWRKRKAGEAVRNKAERYSTVADSLCEMGRYGQKTQAGYYRYEPGNRTPVPDKVVDAVIVEAAAAAGIERRAIGDDEILSRCLYPLINEGALILEEGIAARASDIDTVWVNGYGFPTYRGGPMFYADTVGAKPIYDTVCHYHQLHGDIWRPAPLLKRLAESGGSFCA